MGDFPRGPGRGRGRPPKASKAKREEVSLTFLPGIEDIDIN